MPTTPSGAFNKCQLCVIVYSQGLNLSSKPEGEGVRARLPLAVLLNSCPNQNMNKSFH